MMHSAVVPVRFQVLDGWRGMCALMVALFHLDVATVLTQSNLIRHAYLFVDFFFVLSGFVITHAYARKLDSAEDAGRFIIRRLGRVWPLHLAMLAAFVALELVKLGATTFLSLHAGQPAFHPAGETSLGHLPANALLLHALGLHDRLTWNAPSWSISAEFWTYAVFAVICVALPRTRTIAIGVAGLAGMAAVLAWSQRGLDATYDLGFARALAGFSLGHLVYVLRHSLSAIAPRAEAYLSLLEWPAIAAAIVFVSVAGGTRWEFAAPLLFALVVLVFSYEAGTASSLVRTTPFLRLGLWSYSIYMVHYLISHALDLGISVLERALKQPIWHHVTMNGEALRIAEFGSPLINAVVLIGYVGGVVLAASMTYRFIEQPGRRLFARIADRLSGCNAVA
ncbi:MAG: acyltransferase family protein [Hyphomicrobiaceae bacterium]